jgi:hypothetical protein
MADDAVQVKDLIAIVKILFSQVIDLTASVMTLRAALMQANNLPVPAEELTRLHKFFAEEYAPLQEVRKTIENIGVSTPAEIEKLLRDFQGPIQ